MTLPTTSTVDYRTWTNEQLISRVAELESRLAFARSARPDATEEGEGVPSLVKGSRSEPKSKRVKTSNRAQRPFDFHKYQTRYVAFKFAYLGWHYNGLVTQDMPTELPTVEEEIFKALLKTRLIEHPEACRFSRCGRTDKGVSAMGQVMALNVRSAFLRDASDGSPSTQQETGKDEDEGVRELPWLEQLNGCLPPSIRILAYDDRIPATFDARFSCVRRHYKYLLAPRVPGAQPLDVDAMREACSYFLGTHDFRNFCKLDASKQITNFHRSILRCEINEDLLGTLPGGNGSGLSAHPLGLYVLDLEGTAFLWHQVRCITAILLLVGQRLERPTVVRDLLDVVKTPQKPIYEMADDWPLTLYDCDFGEEVVRWKYPRSSQRTLESTFATLHEARIKDAISSFMVGAAADGVSEESIKPGIILGDGRVKVRATYVPIMQRKRMADVETLNAAFAEKKDRKRAEKRMVEGDVDMISTPT